MTDHLGQTFQTFGEMCRHYEVLPETCLNLLRRGKPLEEALTPSRANKPVVDHLGNEYSSIMALCNHHGINYHAYIRQKARGYSVEEILSRQRIYTGLDGEMFTSMKEMAKHYGIGYSTLKRAHATLSPSDFLDYLRHPERGFGASCVIDHEGNQFKTLEDMLKHYGITHSAYAQRLRKLKWSLEKTLTTPVRKRSTVIKDHLGNAYGITKSSYWNRLKAGWSLEKTLTTPIRQC